MTGAEYRTAIAKLGMSQRRAARFFEKGSTTASRWAEKGPSIEAGMLLILMVKLRITPEWVDYWLGRTGEGGER